MADIGAKIVLTSENVGAIKGIREVKDATTQLGAGASAAALQGAGAFDRQSTAAATAAAATTAAATSTAQAAAGTAAALTQGAAATAAASGQATAAIAQQGKAAGVSAAQTAAALRQLPAQFTDIATSLAGGQSPLTVLLQQGGQIKDSFGGVGAAARALGGYVAGLVGPFTLAAGAAALLAVAYSQGSQEADAYAQSLILTGNAAGTSVGRLQDMASRIDGVVGTQAKAAETLAQFAGAANISPAGMEQFATAAIRMERAVGTSVADTVKQFSELGRAPLEASVKLNSQINYLTVSVYQQIRALSEAGRTTEAAALAQKAYADAMESRAGQIEERLGLVERGWRGVKDAAKEAWDAMLNIGRKDTLQDQLAAAEKQLQEAAAPRRGANPLQGDARRNAIRERIDALKEQIQLEGRSATRQAQGAADTQAVISAEAYIEKLRTEAGLRTGLNRELEIYRENVTRLAGTDKEVSPGDKARMEAAIRKRYVDKTAQANEDAQAALGLSQARAASNARLNLLEDESATLAVARAADLVGVSEFEHQKTRIQADQLAERADLIEQEIALEQRRKPTDEAGRTGQKTKITGLQDQLSGVRADQKRLPLVAQAGDEQRSLDDSRQRAQAWAQAWTTAKTQVTQLAEQNARSRAALITDPVARAGAELDLQVAAIRKQADQLTKELQLTLGLTIDPAQRDLLQTQITAVGEQSAEAIVLANAGLAERMKPGWQRMVEGWGNATQVMRDSFDTLTSGVVQQGEDAFVKLAKDGKASAKDLTAFIRTELAKGVYRQSVGGKVAGFTDALLQGNLSGFLGLGKQAGSGLKVPGLGAGDAAATSFSLAGGRLGSQSVAPRLGGAAAPGAAGVAGAASEAADAAATSLTDVSAAAQQVTTTATGSAAALAGQGQAVLDSSLATQALTTVTQASQGAEMATATDQAIENQAVGAGLKAMGEAAVETAIKLRVAGSVSGGAAGSAVGHIFTGAARFANGGSFTNSIVTSNTYFRFRQGGQTRLGLMGEAGDEAVMPLRRTGGAHTVDAVDRSGRLVGGMQLRRGPGGRLAVQAFASGGAFGSGGGVRMAQAFASGGTFGSGARIAQALSQPGGGGALAASEGATLHFRPVIQIDSRTDSGQITQLVGAALQQGRKQMVAELRAQGVIR